MPAPQNYMSYIKESDIEIATLTWFEELGYFTLHVQARCLPHEKLPQNNPTPNGNLSLMSY
jgi:hypothetical protein